MALDANKAADIQSVCDKILQVNQDWYDQDIWSCVESRIPLFLLPDSVYFHYSNNSGELYKSVDVLQDIYDAVSVMASIYPTIYGVVLDKDKNFIPYEIWYDLLNDLSDDKLKLPWQHSGSPDITNSVMWNNSDFLNQMNDALDYIDYYWRKSLCSVSTLTDLQNVWQDLKCRCITVGDKPVCNWTWDLQDRLFDIIRSKPIKYSYACNNGLDYVPCDRKVFGGFGYYPSQFLDCSEISYGIQFMTDPSLAGWQVSYCDTVILDALNERRDIFGMPPIQPKCHRWIWKLRDEILNIAGNFVDPSIQIDGALTNGGQDNEFDPLGLNSDRMSDILGFDVTNAVCCDELKSMLNLLKYVEWGRGDPGAGEDGDVPLIFTFKFAEAKFKNGSWKSLWHDSNGYNWKDMGTDWLQSGGPDQQSHFWPMMQAVWNGDDYSGKDVGGPTEWGGFDNPYLEGRKLTAESPIYHRHWSGRVEVSDIKIGSTASTRRKRVARIYLGCTDYQQRNDCSGYNCPNITLDTYPYPKPNYIDSNGNGLWREAYTFGPNKDATPKTDRFWHTNSEPDISFPADGHTAVWDSDKEEWKDPGEGGIEVYFMQRFNALRIDDYTPDLTIF